MAGGGMLATTDKPTAEEVQVQQAGAGKKRKQQESSASSSEAGGDDRDEQPKREEDTAEKKTEEDVASESGEGALNTEKEEEEGDSLYEAGEMLRLWEEYWELLLLSKDSLVPGALDRFLERKKKKKETTQTPQVPATVAAGNNNKRKKVVRIMVPESYMDDLIRNKKSQVSMAEKMCDAAREILTQQEIATHLEKYSQSYAIAKLINAKYNAYRQALIAQYSMFGFAYDEAEVTDDDEKEEVPAVKN